MTELPFNAVRVLDKGFVGLVGHMGDDTSIVQAARISYGKDKREDMKADAECILCGGSGQTYGLRMQRICTCSCLTYKLANQQDKDRDLIRYLMRHRHSTPFEMVEFKFIVRVPMDCWRQWIRHRTASVNEYSTRYTEAIDSMQTTSPESWRLQTTNNKQGSSGFLDAGVINPNITDAPRSGNDLSEAEKRFHSAAQSLYQERLAVGIAKEQARKDLPLSTYTEAYWKINLHNLFHFLVLRMDSHAQLEIRSYANAIFDIIKPIVPEAVKAFEDYRLNGTQLTGPEIKVVKYINVTQPSEKEIQSVIEQHIINKREQQECLTKLKELEIV